MSSSDDDSADEAEQLAMLRAMHQRKGNLPVVKQDLLKSLSISSPSPSPSLAASAASTPAKQSTPSSSTVAAAPSSSSTTTSSNSGPGYYGVVLHEADFESVTNARGWITDEIISFYIAYLEHHVYGSSTDVLIVRPTLSFMTMFSTPMDLKQNVGPLELHKRQVVIWPITNERHWGLLVWHRRTRTYIYHDSVGGSLLAYARALMKQTAAFVLPPSSTTTSTSSSSTSTSTSEYDFKIAPTPQQVNDFDCGLYVMRLMDEWCEQWFSKDSQRGTSSFSSSTAAVATASIDSDDDDHDEEHDSKTSGGGGTKTHGGLDIIDISERLTPVAITSFRGALTKLIHQHHPPIMGATTASVILRTAAATTDAS